MEARSGGTGRRAGLKIQWYLVPCGFDPLLRDQTYTKFLDDAALEREARGQNRRVRHPPDAVIIIRRKVGWLRWVGRKGRRVAMDQETPKVNPEALKAAVDDLWEQLRKDWGDFPHDRSTVPWEDSCWESFQEYAKAKYGQADAGLKKEIEKAFDRQDRWGHRRFRAFRDLDVLSGTKW